MQTSTQIQTESEPKRENCFLSNLLFLLFVGSLDIVGRSRVEDRDAQIYVNLLPHCTRLNLKHTRQSHVTARHALLHVHQLHTQWNQSGTKSDSQEDHQELSPLLEQHSHDPTFTSVVRSGSTCVTFSPCGSLPGDRPTCRA